jgi:hypothetical protein
MNSIKCAECGLVNFASALECKRCHTKFYHPEFAADDSSTDQIPDGMDSQGSPDAGPLEIEDEGPRISPLPDYFTVPEPEPYGGPVMLFAANLFLSVLIASYQFIEFAPWTKDAHWDIFTSPSSRFYVFGIEPILYFDWSIKGVAVITAVLLSILLLKRLRSFLIAVRIYLFGGLLYFGLEMGVALDFRAKLSQLKVGAEIDPLMSFLVWQAYLGIIGMLIILIWLRYFTSSQSVRKIFVN